MLWWNSRCCGILSVSVLVQNAPPQGPKSCSWSWFCRKKAWPMAIKSGVAHFWTQTYVLLYIIYYILYYIYYILYIIYYILYIILYILYIIYYIYIPQHSVVATGNGPSSGFSNWGSSHLVSGYPLVNIQKTMENHHFQWVNPLFLWPFSIAFCMFTRNIPLTYH